MRYYCSLALLSCVLLLGGLTSALPERSAVQAQQMYQQGLAGTYVNQETGGFCYVYNLGRGYLFVSDTGERAQFISIGGNQLRSVRTNPLLPDILVTVDLDTFGRTVLAFEVPGKATGYWVYAR